MKQRFLAFHNTVDRLHPTPVSPTLKHQRNSKSRTAGGRRAQGQRRAGLVRRATAQRHALRACVSTYCCSCACVPSRETREKVWFPEFFQLLGNAIGNFFKSGTRVCLYVGFFRTLLDRTHFSTREPRTLSDPPTKASSRTLLRADLLQADGAARPTTQRTAPRCAFRESPRNSGSFKYPIRDVSRAQKMEHGP